MRGLAEAASAKDDEIAAVRLQISTMRAKADSLAGQLAEIISEMRTAGGGGMSEESRRVTLVISIELPEGFEARFLSVLDSLIETLPEVTCGETMRAADDLVVRSILLEDPRHETRHHVWMKPWPGTHREDRSVTAQTCSWIRTASA